MISFVTEKTFCFIQDIETILPYSLHNIDLKCMLFYESTFSSLHIYTVLKIHPKYIHTEMFHVSCMRLDS